MTDSTYMSRDPDIENAKPVSPITVNPVMNMTPKEAIEALDLMAVPHGRDVLHDIADVIRDLVKQAESNVKMRSDMLAAPENQDPE